MVLVQNKMQGLSRYYIIYHFITLQSVGHLCF